MTKKTIKMITDQQPKKYRREKVIHTESYETLEITENISCPAHLLTNAKNQEFIFFA